MKRFLFVVLFISLIQILPSSTAAQSGVSLAPRSDTIGTNVQVNIRLRVTNNTGDTVRTLTNGFRIYSPNGVDWDTTIASAAPIFFNFFDIVIAQDDLYSTNGMGIDSVLFGGVAIEESGLLDGFDEVVWTITIGPIDIQYHGDTICLDSNSVVPEGSWLWAFSPSEGIIPDWDGPHCFIIDSTYTDSLCGDVNLNGTVNILDLVSLINYMYRGSPPPPALNNGNMDGCTGVTVRDLTVLASYIFRSGPVPCTGPVDCVPGSDQGSEDSLKLVFSLLPGNGSNVPIRVDCSVYVDIDTLTTIQFAWKWDNPDVKLDSAKSFPPFSNFGIGSYFFLDSLIATTNDSQIALCSGTSINSSTDFVSPTSGWTHIATYYMTASIWSDSSFLTIDTIQHPDYVSTEYIFIPLGGQYYQPVWGGAIIAAIDTDGDGIPDHLDNCPLIANPAQEDIDSDGIGDSCDTCVDFDGDGFGNPGFGNTCPDDNCPDIYNPGQEDLDLDGIGDSCDPVTDLGFTQSQGDSADVFAMVTFDINRDNFTDIVHIGGANDPGLFITYSIDGTNFDIPIQCFNIFDADLEIGFVNQDSLPDILAATTDTIYVFLNNGTNDCSMWPVIEIPIPSAIRLSSTAHDIPSIASGYFNDDIFLDFVVAPNTIIYGDGAGGATSTATIPVVFTSVIQGDFNNDGYEDLLTVDNDSAILLLNDAAGTGNYTAFSAVFTGAPVVTSPIDNAVADLDRDCNLDFVVITPDVNSSGLSVMTFGYGDGTGSFSQVDTIMIDGIVSDILVTDIDRDNNLDILASNGTQQRVEIYRGNGDRTFQAPEFFSTASAGSAFSLATADFDRDGQPDFLSGSADSGNLLVTTSSLADVEVLPQELVVTGFTNVTMQVTNPLGFSTSENIQTVAGADIWRFDVNGDNTLDEQIVDYNLIDGNYVLTFYLRPEFAAAKSRVTSKLSASVRINGSQEATLFENFTFGTSKIFENSAAISCYTDSLVFVINPLIVDSTSKLLPKYGIKTESSLPSFDWKTLNLIKSEFATTYHFQLDSLLDFTSPLFDDSTLSRPALCDGELRGLLDTNSIYYWRVRADDGFGWSEFSNTMVAYIGAGSPCCVGRRGDMNGDDTNDPNILDLTYLVDFIFRGGVATACFEEGDANGDCSSNNIIDLTFLVDYIFRGGPAPGPCP